MINAVVGGRSLSETIRISFMPEKFLTYEEREIKRDNRLEARIRTEREKGLREIKRHAALVRRELGLK